VEGTVKKEGRKKEKVILLWASGIENILGMWRQ
jgi:hypothetical protein